MNRWSTSLPSIISLCNNVQFTFDPMFMQQAAPASTSCANQNDNTAGSLTDLSILIQTQQPFVNFEEYQGNFEQPMKQETSFYNGAIEHETTIHADITTHEQFVPDNELLQSLVAYADSFDLDSTVYSIQNSKDQQMTPSTSISTMQTIPTRRRTQSSTTHLTSLIENNTMARHKSCDDLSITCSITSSSKPTTVIRRTEQTDNDEFTQFVPSESHPQFYFATSMHTNKNTNNSNNLFDKHYEDKPLEDITSTTGGSKIEWGFSSDTMNELNKPSSDVFSSYEATTNIGDINFNYLKDLEHMSTFAASMDFSQEMSTPIPPPPKVIRRKSKDLLLKQQVDIQLLRPPTPPAPAPIIIREVRHKSSSSARPMTVHQKLEDTGQIHLSKTPSPIVLRERPPLPPKHDYPSKPTIVYRRVSTPSSSSSTVIVERLRSNVATIIQKPPPILVEKWLPYPPEQKRKIIYERASPEPPRREKRRAHEPTKKIIVEYDDVNVIFDRDIRQRKEIKRISPNQYVQRYGNSLYSNEALNQILNSSTCSAQVNREYPMFSHHHHHHHQPHHYENYSPIFHC